jgi:hypothetical protein
MLLGVFPSQAVAVATEAGTNTEASTGTGTASISGRVTAPAGTSVAEVRVHAAYTHDGWWEFTADVDGSGGFTFSGLPAGEYRLDAFDPTGRLVGAVTIRGSESFDLAAGENRAGINIPVVSAASVSGQLTAPAGTDFNALSLRAVSPDDNIRYPALVDAAGNYTVGPLPPGTYELMASSGQGNLRLPANDGSKQLSLSPGQAVTGRNLALDLGEPISGTTGHRAYERISGTVTAPAGVDFSGIEIGIYEVVNPEDQRFDYHYPFGRIRPNAKGEFSVTDLTPGHYVLSLTDRSGKAADVQRFPAAGALTLVGGQALDGVSLQTVPGASIQGRIEIPAPATPDGVTITVRNETGQQQVRSDVPVGPDGRYTIAGLAAGKYSLFLQAGDTGLLGLRIPELVLGQAAGSITVGTGETVDVGTAAMKLGGSLVGKLTGRDGLPLEGVEITAKPINGQSVGRRTGPDGTFTFIGLEPGSYIVKAEIYGVFGPEFLYSGNVKDEAAATVVSVSPGQQSDIGELALARISRFSDVPVGSQFATEIAWAATKGIAEGWPDGSYRPLQPVTRDAMAAFIFRQHDPFDWRYTPPETSPFTDVRPDTQFYFYMAWVAEHGISTGWPDKTYRPLTSVNRDAMAAFMYRMAGSPDYTPPAVSPFTDVSTDHQFYKEIAWLAENEITTGWPDQTFRPLDPVNRDAMAAFMYRYSAKFN